MTLRIVHVIVGLERGGAELMLKRLVLSFLTHPRYQHSVVSLTGLGAVGADLRRRGVDVYALEMSSLWSLPLTVLRLGRLLRQLRPAVVQTWMYHADFLGGWVGRLLGCKVLWGIRSTGIAQGPASVTWWLIRLNALCSRIVPHRIVCCARSARMAHTRLGFAPKKMLVIPNGYDFSELNACVPMRDAVRARWQFANANIVIGVAGRFDPLKDFHNFVRAAGLVARACPEARFLMVGLGVDADNHVLRDWIGREGLADKFCLAGEQTSITPCLAAMDIYCLSSKQEAFPNVVVEAMAVGLPCVVTNAGDASTIVGDGEFVVPVQQPDALARALIKMSRLSPRERLAIGAKNAAAVRSNFDIAVIRRSYEAVYDELTAGQA